MVSQDAVRSLPMAERRLQRMVVGCYTEGIDNPRNLNSVCHVELDTDSGALAVLGGSCDVENASYLCVGPRRDLVYAVQETTSTPSVHALQVSAKGDIHHLGAQPVPDTWPCHLSFDPTGRRLAVATYGTGTVALYPIDAGGAIGAMTSAATHQGCSIHPTRQDRPHAHAVVFASGGSEVLVPDLGIDEVKRYQVLDGGRIEPLASICLEPGSGPRHLVLDENGQVAYVLNELSSTIAVVVREGDQWSVIRYVPCAPEMDPQRSLAAAIRLAPSGRFLYASNRGFDTIAVFRVNRTAHDLHFVAWTPAGGATPRDFALDPSGRLMVVANQGSNEIVTFWVDPLTGRLTSTGHSLGVARPACVLML